MAKYSRMLIYVLIISFIGRILSLPALPKKTTSYELKITSLSLKWESPDGDTNSTYLHVLHILAPYLFGGKILDKQGVEALEELGEKQINNYGLYFSVFLDSTLFFGLTTQVTLSIL